MNILFLTNIVWAQEMVDPPAEEVVEETPLVIEEKFIHKTLDNGMQISVYSNPTYPIVATQIWVSVGGAHETDEERGFAHLFEHLMFGKTKNHDKEQYNRR